MKKKILLCICFLLLMIPAGTYRARAQEEGDDSEVYTLETRVADVMEDPVFEGYGRLIFPVDRTIPEDLTLADVGDILIWYHNVNPDKAVEIVNYMKNQVQSGEQIFYDIYTEEEKIEDPEKENTGLFFFRGQPGGHTAIVNAGGGFAYVAAMHDSFPHALELSKMGYNAFALIYRPGAQTACEDLARAIAFIHENAGELELDVSGYSLWGGSAGARMAAWLGSYGTEAFGEEAYPAPGAVIMQYTGLSEVTGTEPPTYACVGTNDGIASWQVMEDRIRRIQEQGTPAEIEIFDGLSHGFGLGEGTVADGWIERAADFWDENVQAEEGAGPSQASEEENASETGTVTPGTEEYRGFLLDNVLHSPQEGEIHYNVYIPDSYDGSRPYAVFFTLPGYEGLYFQGVGVNLQAEEFGFTAQSYNPDMIVVAPQLNDWGETSARQTIALVEYFLSSYNIDPQKVYANGYSGGGETMSLVMGMRPDLFTAYLHCSSQWDGSFEPVVESRTPVYLVIGEEDEYYGAEPTREAYEQLHALYEKAGLTEEEIGRLLVLDIKDSSYFESQGITNQHGGGGALFSQDEEIMGWLFGQ